MLETAFSYLKDVVQRHQKKANIVGETPQRLNDEEIVFT